MIRFFFRRLNSIQTRTHTLGGVLLIIMEIDFFDMQLVCVCVKLCYENQVLTFPLKYAYLHSLLLKNGARWQPHSNVGNCGEYLTNYLYIVYVM